MQRIRKKILNMLVVSTVLAYQSHFSGVCGKEDPSSNSNAPGGAAGGTAPPPPPPMPTFSPPKKFVRFLADKATPLLSRIPKKRGQQGDSSASVQNSQQETFDTELKKKLKARREAHHQISDDGSDGETSKSNASQTAKTGSSNKVQIFKHDRQTTKSSYGKVQPDTPQQEQSAPLPSLNQEAKTAILQGGTPPPPPPPPVPVPAAVPLSTTLNVKLSKPSQQNSSDSPKKLDPFQIAIANAIAKRAEKNPDVNLALRNMEQDRASRATSGDNKTPLTPKLREITKPDKKQTSSATSTADILPKIMLKKINERFKEPDRKESPSGEEFTQLNESDSSEWVNTDNRAVLGAISTSKSVKPAVSQTPPPVASRRNPATSQKSLSTKNQEAHKKPEAQRNAEQNERQQNYAKLKANDSPSDPPHRQHNGERASLPPTNGHASGAIPKKNNPEVPPKPKKVQQTSKPVEKVAPQIPVLESQTAKIPQDLAMQNQAGEPPKTDAELRREALQNRRQGTNPDSAKKKRRRAEAEATERQRLEELQGQDSWDLPPLPQQQEPALENGDIPPDTHSENGDIPPDTHSENGDAHLDTFSENDDNPPEETQRVRTRRRHLNAALKGVSGGFFMGYGKQWGRVYLGLEASYLLSGEKGKLAIDLPVHKKDTLEVAFRPGIVVKRTLFYGKIGVANSRFKLSGEFQRFHGLSLGCGVDVKLSPWMLMGMGYTCIFYRKKIFFDQTVFTELKPRSHRLMLRMAYTF